MQKIKRLTLEHIRQYLASLQEDDEVGRAGHACKCLAAHSITFIYGNEHPYVYGTNTYWRAQGSASTEGYIDASVTPLLDTFDNIPSKESEFAVVHKRQLRNNPVFAQVL